MRSPTSFKKEVQDLTPEGRISDLERDRPILIEKISLCDKLQLQVDHISEKIQPLQDLIKSLEENQEATLKRFTVLQDQLLETLRSLQDLREKNLETSEKAARLCKASSDSSQVAIGDLRRLFQSHIDEVNSRMMKFALTDYVDDQNRTVNGLRAEGQLKQDDKIEEALRQVRELKQHCDRFFDITATKAFVTMSACTMNANLSERISKLEDSIKMPFQQVKDQLNAVLMDVILLKKSQQDPKEVVDEIKKDFDHKLSLISLDSSNACLRSQNAEQKLAMLERRIENLDLRVKKGEIKA